MDNLTVEREFKSDVTIYLDGIHVLSNDEARRLIFNLALHVWPELSEKNALRLLANETMSQENQRLKEQLSQFLSDSTDVWLVNILRMEPGKQARLLAQLRERFPIDSCNWVVDEDSGAYDTDCGRTFPLNDGTLAENEMAFCCYCGGMAVAQGEAE